MTAIEVTRDDEHATVTISNPERMNAVSPEGSQELARTLRTVANEGDVRCVVVTGEGDAFCSGLDLAGGLQGQSVTAELETGFNAVVRQLVRMEKPTVAAVPGPAVGAGASIATACDFVYARDDATVGWGFTDIGLAPDTGATYVLPRLVGYRRAMELLTTARRLDAEECLDMGIVNEVIPAEEYEETLAERVEMLASRPTKAVAATKRLLHRNTHRSLEEALWAEARDQERMMLTDDFAEGVGAFFEDREPEFEGQ